MLVVGALISMVTVDRLGRRFLFIEAGVQMISSMVRYWFLRSLLI
jgi:hypothetical protein